MSNKEWFWNLKMSLEKEITKLKENVKDITKILGVITEGRVLELEAHNNLEDILRDHIIWHKYGAPLLDEQLAKLDKTEKKELEELKNLVFENWKPEKKESGGEDKIAGVETVCPACGFKVNNFFKSGKELISEFEKCLDWIEFEYNEQGNISISHYIERVREIFRGRAK